MLKLQSVKVRHFQVIYCLFSFYLSFVWLTWLRYELTKGLEKVWNSFFSFDALLPLLVEFAPTSLSSIVYRIYNLVPNTSIPVGLKILILAI